MERNKWNKSAVTVVKHLHRVRPQSLILLLFGVFEFLVGFFFTGGVWFSWRGGIHSPEYIFGGNDVAG